MFLFLVDIPRGKTLGHPLLSVCSVNRDIQRVGEHISSLQDKETRLFSTNVISVFNVMIPE